MLSKLTTNSPVRSNDEIEVRRFTSKDNLAFYAAVRESIESLTYWMPWCKSDYSLQNATDWMNYCGKAWEEKTDFPLGIFELATGKVIGGIGIHPHKRLIYMGEIGYWVTTPYHGRGIAKAAASMAADIGFNELGLIRIEIVALLQNNASRKVAQSIGAMFECNARNRLYFNGLATDAAIYSLIPSDLKRMENHEPPRKTQLR